MTTPRNRAPSSQFYWRDWLADPAVRAMNYEQRGRYMDYLALTHQTERPGINSEDQVRQFLGYEEAEWPAVRDTFARAFKIKNTSQPLPTWVQKRVVMERNAQKMRYSRAKKGADVTNGVPTKSPIERPAKRSLKTERAVAPASASASASASAKQNPLSVSLASGQAPEPDRRVARGEGASAEKATGNGHPAPNRVAFAMPTRPPHPSAEEQLSELQRKYPEAKP